jgi:hypothetical protein
MSNSRLSLNTVTVRSSAEKERFAHQVWRLLNDAYENVVGGLHFCSVVELIETTDEWRLSLVNNEVVALIILKAKKGLKISAFCLNRKYHSVAKSQLISLLTESFKNCWIEASEAAEKFIMRYCNGAHFLINNHFTHRLLNKPTRHNQDGFHYAREVNGIVKEKVIIGTPSEPFM